MQRCSEVVRLISSDDYLAASPLNRFQIRLHLVICKQCSKYARQLRAIAKTLRNSSGAAPSTREVEDAKSRILRYLLG